MHNKQEKICQACINYKWRNPQPTLDGQDFCIFHASAESKSHLNNTFTETLNNILEEATTHEKPPSEIQVNLSGSIFTVPVTIINKNIPYIIFSDCTFIEPFTIKTSTIHWPAVFTNSDFMSEASFIDATFKQTVKFENSRTHGKISFKKTTFGSDASFNGTSFNSVKFIKSEFFAKASFKKCIFNNTTSFEESTFLAEAQFTKSSFNNIVNFSKSIFLSSSCFNECNFYKDCNFEEASLGNTQFADASFYKCSNFEKAKFGENTLFKRTKFGKKAIFKTAHFKGDVTFSQSHTGNDFSLEHATIKGNASFNKAVFESRAVLSRSNFESNVTLDGIDIHSKLVFNNAILGSKESHTISLCNIKSGKEINLSSSQFGGIFTIENTNFDGKLRLDHCRFATAAIFRKSDIGYAEFQLAHFKEKPIFDRVNLSRTNFFDAPVEDFRFISCTWPESHGRRVPHDARKFEAHGFFEITNAEHPIQPLTPYETNPENTTEIMQNIEDLCRRLKKSAKNEQDERLASDFHYAEKELQLAHATHTRSLNVAINNTTTISRRRNIHTITILWIYRFLSGYGESPERALLILAVLITTPLIVIWVGDMFPSLYIESFRLDAPGVLNKFAYFSPLVKIPDPGMAGQALRPLLAAYHIILTLQATLFGFALKNRFHR